MDKAIMDLKQDFHAHLRTSQGGASTSTRSSLAILTQEELRELEHAWIALVVWKRNHTHEFAR
ncbi:hypothetical protein HGP28_14195 [Vibrio sp. SM6]|uniref:3-demethylubiquinone-9 3-methyltransferase n=1 Tax=Vibrio agarilyticus TaxID=2726741 RepID=A0A7X8TSX4_9VIBR|nr:hypothetical protein [Vibrio agarilyticus]NLS14041.1 hypothetical protein [Vibrio agarilyticus]